VRERATGPAEAVREGASVASELAWLLFMPQDSPTRFKGKPRGQKRVAWTDPLLLPEVKVVSRVLGCSVNDMLLAAVAGSLGVYLAAKGDPTDGVELRALVPVNLRNHERSLQLGNQFGVLALELPLGIPNPLARLYEIRRRMEALKRSHEAPVTLGLLAALGYAPRLVQDQLFGLLLSRASAVMTNVPGPQHPLYLAGSRVQQVMFWVPQAGDIAMGISVLSFDGQVQFGVMTDAATVPDPEEVVARFHAEFEKLLFYVLMEPWSVIPARQADATPEQPAPHPAESVRDRSSPRARRAALRRPVSARTSKAPASGKQNGPH
jgi:WS/DGAT/MGAT family acyltransferase